MVRRKATWKRIVNEKDYKLWKKGTSGRSGTTVAVYRNMFSVAGKSYRMKSKKEATQRAMNYMKKRSVKTK
tara:strand:- start:266 stop:478 length:213 start_codon:yes stop_codon:yes gene_type:complete